MSPHGPGPGTVICWLWDLSIFPAIFPSSGPLLTSLLAVEEFDSRRNIRNDVFLIDNRTLSASTAGLSKVRGTDYSPYFLNFTSFFSNS